MRPIKDLRRENLNALIAVAGGQSALATMIKRDRNQVYQWLLSDEDPASRGIGDKMARHIEEAMGLKPGWMDAIHETVTDHIHASDGYSISVSQSDATGGHIPRSDFRRVPVVGTASLGMDGYWTDLEYPKGQGDGYFEFPTTDKDAYVLQVRGGSMHPAIRSGWYVVIEPNKSPQMGEFVLVKLVDGRSTVKEFLWHRDGEYVLNAIATNDRLVISEDEIEVIHHVGGILPPSGRQS